MLRSAGALFCRPSLFRFGPRVFRLTSVVKSKASLRVVSRAHRGASTQFLECQSLTFAFNFLINRFVHDADLERGSQVRHDKECWTAKSTITLQKNYALKGKVIKVRQFRFSCKKNGSMRTWIIRKIRRHPSSSHTKLPSQ